MQAFTELIKKLRHQFMISSLSNIFNKILNRNTQVSLNTLRSLFLVCLYSIYVFCIRSFETR